MFAIKCHRCDVNNSISFKSSNAITLEGSQPKFEHS